jgi:teichuronic acid exporter
MSLKRKALSGIFWTFVQQFSVQGVGFLVSIILARLLMPKEFGLIAMISVFISLGNIFINSGMSQSLMRTQDLDDDDYSSVFYFNLFISIIIYLIVFFLAPHISDFYKQEILTYIIRVYSITFFINALSIIQITKLTKQLKFKLQTFISVPSTLLSSFIGVYMAYNGYGIWSLVFSTLSQSFISTILLWYFGKWTPCLSIKYEKIKKHWNFGYKLLFSGLLDTIFNNIFSIIVGRFFAISQVGYYQRAETLKQFPVSNIILILDKVTYPLLASIQDEDQRLKLVYSRILQMVIFIVAPMLIFSAVLAEPIFRFLFTDKWLPAVPYFQVLCVNGILYPVHAYNLNILSVKGRSDLFLKLEIIKTIILTLIIIISLQWGIYGLLFGGIISSILAFFVNTYYTNKLIAYSPIDQIKDLFPIILLAAVIGFIISIIDHSHIWFLNQDIIRILFGLTFGVSMFLIFAFLLKFKSLNEFNQIIIKK